MDLYSEIILDYFKHPRNKEELQNASAQVTETNPLCGDKITVYLKVDANSKIEKITFNGEGCAISQAATSMLTEELTGKSLQDLKNMENEDIYNMLGIDISPARVKCALLGLVTAKKAGIIAEHNK